MFQFPGFALKTLCIQVISTCLCSLLITEVNNNKQSGGLPHSEIHGSKHILGSPWLIAEYHVFHRLLLPRHSPNALFALDLIQKKLDLHNIYRFLRPSWFTRSLFFRSKVILFPLKHTYMFEHLIDLTIVRVSVLDLDNMFISTCILSGGRGNSQDRMLSTGRSLLHKIEIGPLRRMIKQCCNCISLYDVNYMPSALQLSCGTVRLDG